MSTFIYQNGVLYADTRKIVNFPKRQMMLAVSDSKVTSNAWSHVATGGFEKSDGWWRDIYRLLSIVESFYALFDVLQEISKNDKELLIKALAMKLDTMKLLDLYLKAEASIISEPFLALTKRRVYGFDGDLVEPGCVAKIIVHSLDSIEAIGSSCNAARILLINGVHPKEIYRVLRDGYAPVGETCEEFNVSSLSDAIAPWCDLNVWIYATLRINDKIKNLSFEQKQQLIALVTLIEKMGTISNNTIRTRKKEIIKVIDLWQSKAYLEFADYKENFGVIFK